MRGIAYNLNVSGGVESRHAGAALTERKYSDATHGPQKEAPRNAPPHPKAKEAGVAPGPLTFIPMIDCDYSYSRSFSDDECRRFALTRDKLDALIIAELEREQARRMRLFPMVVPITPKASAIQTSALPAAPATPA